MKSATGRATIAELVREDSDSRRFFPPISLPTKAASAHQRMITRIALIFCLALPSLATAAAPVLPTFERFHEDKANSASLGRLLLGELNCTSCHAATDELNSQLMTKQAPILSKTGSRLKPEFLRSYIANPHLVKPGSTMPKLFGDGTSPAAKQEVEALVHFLMSTADDEIPQAYANYGSRPRGERLYHEVGCAVCHHDHQSGDKTLATTVPYGDLAAKYTIATLTNFLADPLHTRPSGRMPKLNLSRSEAADIAAYLLPKVPEKSGIAYRYFEGDFNEVPDFEKLTPKASGAATEISVGPKQRGDKFGLQFEGSLQIDQSGEYKFELGSDDGSKLYIDGKLAVDHGGVHGFNIKSEMINLEKGLHGIRIDFFEQGGGEQLEVYYSGPGVKRVRIDQAMLSAVVEEPLEDLSFSVDPQLAAKGKVLFQNKGCASCHDLQLDGARISSQLKAPTVASLDWAKGCMTGEGTVPDYDLSKAQQAAIVSAAKETGKLDDQAHINQTMLAANCYACHARDKMGGVEETRNKTFKGTEPEMGDEGRIPPKLDGVGAKLTSVWLERILNVGAKDRPYMLTRMPAFGKENVGHLAGIFEKTDHVDPLPKIALDKSAKKLGQQMVGSKGFSCIKCHTFGKYKATGVQSIDMTIMAKRLREDWFRAYVRNPLLYRRDTRMPSAWPAFGKSLLPEILDGDSDKQIQAVWNYLKDGPRARPPAGLVTNSMELFATDEAVIYRNFIEGAGSRAIGVGYPEALNLAFDANEIHLALVWKGAFIDAKRHWTGRGQGYQPPAGSSVMEMEKGPTIARLVNKDASWPSGTIRENPDYRFRGYRLTVDQRPTFIYTLGNVRVEEFYEPIEKDTTATFMKKVVVKGAGEKDTYYRLASADRITEEGDGWYQIGDRYRTKLSIPADARLITRESGGKTELLLQLAVDLRFTQEIDW